MDTLGRNNFARLRGTLAGPVILSQQNRQERFFRFPLRTERLSGTEDVVNVLARERLLQTDLPVAKRLDVSGEIRTFNNTSGVYCTSGAFGNRYGFSGERCLVEHYFTLFQDPVQRDHMPGMHNDEVIRFDLIYRGQIL